MKLLNIHRNYSLPFKRTAVPLLSFSRRFCWHFLRQRNIHTHVHTYTHCCLCFSSPSAALKREGAREKESKRQCPCPCQVFLACCLFQVITFYALCVIRYAHLYIFYVSERERVWQLFLLDQMQCCALG